MLHTLFWRALDGASNPLSYSSALPPPPPVSPVARLQIPQSLVFARQPTSYLNFRPAAASGSRRLRRGRRRADRGPLSSGHPLRRRRS